VRGVANRTAEYSKIVSLIFFACVCGDGWTSFSLKYVHLFIV